MLSNIENQIISQQEYIDTGKRTETCRKCNSPLVLRTYINEDPYTDETEYQVYECDNCKIQFDVCPECKLMSLQHDFDSNVMGDFEYDHCHNPKCNFFKMIDSSPPKWFIQESRELTQKHRVLPTGEIEFAGPYGGY